MSDASAIEVHNLAKRYRLGEQDVLHGSLRDAVSRTFANALHRARRRPRAARDFIWALDDVSFEVAARRGGRHHRPQRRRQEHAAQDPLAHHRADRRARRCIRGRVGSLLEVGTGFHPELTGRENIFLNGAILGMRRAEIERKFDEIVAFAEVERFIDTPVKRYSSGMYVRLAFAVAAHLEPEILIVDEVLAVGDAAFQKKCLGKMGEVSGEGRTVLFVSHNMAAITSLATRCLWLDAGRVRALGPARETVASYLTEGHVAERAWVRRPARPADPRRRPQADAEGDHVRERPAPRCGREDVGRLLRARRAAARALLPLDDPDDSLEVLCKFSTLEGVLVFTLASGAMEVDVEPGPFTLTVEIPSLPLRRGAYVVDLYALTSLPQDDVRSAVELEVSGPRGPVADPREVRDELGVVGVEHEWGAVQRADVPAQTRA